MKYDVIIIGGGPAGLCFARNLVDTGLNIALIEKQPEKVLADPAYDGREIALTHLSKSIMSDLGMWDLVPDERISLIKKAKVFNGKSNYALSFDHEEAGEENLGFMIANNEIRKAAFASLKGFKNFTLMTEAEVSDLGTNQEKGWVTLSDGTTIEAPLIVAADSRFSAARGSMGISTSMLDFGRSCIVCRMGVEQSHLDTAYECFQYDRTLAVLPLNDNCVSIVLTLKSEESDAVLAMSDEDFAADIQGRTEGQLGNMKLVSKLFHYPLVATCAKSFHGNRFALIGDAAVGMHPVTAHGFNLGLRGGHTLAAEIKNAISVGSDFSSQTVLESYSRKHRHITMPLYHGTNALVRLYTKTTRSAKFVRRALLHLGNHIKPAKRLIMDQLTDVKSI